MTQSCFLPGTQIQFAWDSTSLGYFKTCPRLYYYAMIEGWAPRGESVHLRWGQEFHAALQDFDIARAKGANRHEAMNHAVGLLLTRTAGWEPDIDPDKRSQKLKTKDALFQIVIDYLDHYAQDPAQTVILDNGAPAVELSFRFELDFGPNAAQILDDAPMLGIEYTPIADDYSQPYLLCGHLDRVVDFHDSIFVMDRKTSTTTLGQYYFAQYDVNNQMTLYTLAGRVILNAPVRGVIIDAAQILTDSTRFVRGFTYRTEDQLEEWLQDLRWALTLAESYAAEAYWPQNDTACDKFGGCRFRGICSKSPQVRENFLRSEFTQLEESERWNPLKPR